MVSEKNSKRYRQVGLITIVAVYILILVGGIVRSTGSGMGCPDWPKCFGSYVPPTNSNELPENYKEIYSQKRRSKNEKLASYLRMLNLNHLATKIAGDPSVYDELDFNATKTWIEYLNRLLGVVVGILIFLVVLYSVPYLKEEKSIFFLSLMSFVVVGITGWLGSVIVSTNLLPFTITIHMILALLLVVLLIYAVLKSYKKSFIIVTRKEVTGLKVILYSLMALTLFQIISGTQVREEIDTISSSLNYQMRETWIDNLGEVFNLHRLMSIVLFVAHIVFLVLAKNNIGESSSYFKLSFTLIALLIVELILGICLSSMGLPAFIQPLHLLMATMIFGLQFFLLISLTLNLKIDKNQLKEVVSI